MLWQIVLLLILVWVVVLRWKSRKVRMAAKKLKSDLTRLPLVGDIYHFIGTGEDRMAGLKLFGQKSYENRGWISVQLGPKYYGLVTDAEDAEYILKTHLEKDDILKITQMLIGNGLVFAPVSIWRPRRKILAPTFTQSNLNQFLRVFNERSVILGNILNEKADGKVFSLWTDLTAYSMDAICLTTLGIDMGIQKIGDNDFLSYLKQFMDLTAARIFYPWLHNEVGFKVLGYFSVYPKMKECVDYMHGYVNDIIRKKRIALKENNEKNGSNCEQPLFRPILELLIEASGGEKGYTNEELLEEIQVVLTAGTDTTAVGAGYTTMMLARHPEVQQKLYQEIEQVFGESDRPVASEDLSRMVYLEAVVKESLRLYPPVPITARKIVKEDVTPGGTHLPAGLGIVVSHFGVMRNPKYWGADADIFRPERFFDSPPTHPSAYMPFSAGSRNCLGYKYAMISIMTVTIAIMRRYRLLPADPEELNKPLRISFEIMMKHVDQFRLKLVPRK